MRHLYSAASKWVIGPAPLLLARMLAQVVSTSAPNGVTRPKPVTTTRRIIVSPKRNRPSPLPDRACLMPRQPSASLEPRDELAGLALVLFDVAVGIANGVDLLGRVVGNLDAELFLESHHQLDDVEAVGTQVVDEARVRRDLVFLDAEVLDNDLLNAVRGVAHVLPSQQGWNFPPP